METVRLTVQVRNGHKLCKTAEDVDVDKVEAKASQIAHALMQNFARPKRSSKKANENAENSRESEDR